MTSYLKQLTHVYTASCVGRTIKCQNPHVRVQDDGDEQREDDVDEEHDEAVQVDSRKAVDHRRLEGDHAEGGKHVVAWNEKHLNDMDRRRKCGSL